MFMCQRYGEMHMCSVVMVNTFMCSVVMANTHMCSVVITNTHMCSVVMATTLGSNLPKNEQTSIFAVHVGQTYSSCFLTLCTATHLTL